MKKESKFDFLVGQRVRCGDIGRDKLWQTNDFAPKQNECSKMMSEQEETGEIKGEQRR
jgi:hypothetical protein